MAKLLRLFPDSVTSHPTDPNYQGYFRLAKLIEQSGYSDSTDPKCFETQSFEQELRKLDVSPVLSDFLRYMFVVDFKQRLIKGNTTARLNMYPKWRSTYLCNLEDWCLRIAPDDCVEQLWRTCSHEQPPEALQSLYSSVTCLYLCVLLSDPQVLPEDSSQNNRTPTFQCLLELPYTKRASSITGTE